MGPRRLDPEAVTRTAQLLAGRRNALRRESTSDDARGGGVSLAMTELRIEHLSSKPISRPTGIERTDAVGSPDLRTLRALAERCRARAAEHHFRAPTNLARNYYDGGRDFDVRLTLTLTFASVADAARFLALADPTLARWLRRGRGHVATLSVGEVELALSGRRQQSDAFLERASALLERVADIRPVDLRPRARQVEA